MATGTQDKETQPHLYTHMYFFKSFFFFLNKWTWHNDLILIGCIIFLAELSGLYNNTMLYFNELHTIKVKKLNFKSTKIRSTDYLV